MNLIVLLNAKAGSATSAALQEEAERVRQAFLGHGVDVHVRPVAGFQLATEAKHAAMAGVDAVVAAGGDGTISSVAGVLAGGKVPLGVLPLGTLNHFAKDLGIPLDLTAAAKVVLDGHMREVDVAEVNGHVFINNSSIGIYPQVVRDRDSQQTRLGRSKWTAMLFAIIGAMRRFSSVRVRIGVGDQSMLRTAPFVFIGNNTYTLEAFSVGTRKCLDEGHLRLYTAHRTGRFGMLVLALRALFGRLDQAKDFDSLELSEVWIESGKRRLYVATDGEVRRLATPLHYTIRPRALRVIAPRPDAGV